MYRRAVRASPAEQWRKNGTMNKRNQEVKGSKAVGRKIRRRLGEPRQRREKKNEKKSESRNESTAAVVRRISAEWNRGYRAGYKVMAKVFPPALPNGLCSTRTRGRSPRKQKIFPVSCCFRFFYFFFILRCYVFNRTPIKRRARLIWSFIIAINLIIKISTYQFSLNYLSFKALCACILKTTFPSMPFYSKICLFRIVMIF